MAKRPPPQFSQLLASYPAELAPCDQGWSNQCAIRMSIALEGAGFKLTDYKQGPTCKHGHARGAQSLGDYLWSQIRPPKVSKSTSLGRSRTHQKTGVIVFKDIDGFQGGRGDHIDLWNRTGTITGEYFDAAQETWFWEIP